MECYVILQQNCFKGAQGKYRLAVAEKAVTNEMQLFVDTKLQSRLRSYLDAY